MTVPKQIENAFAELASLGYTAKADFKCCVGHALEALECEEVDPEKVVFYTEHDADLLWSLDSAVPLSWSGDGKVITDVLRKHKLAPVWSGKPEDRIMITWTMRN